jgi:hypothetical protein
LQLKHNAAFYGNRIRKEGDAAPEGKTLKGKSHECKGYEIKPRSGWRSNPLIGWENLKAERTKRGKFRVSGLKP